MARRRTPRKKAYAHPHLYRPIHEKSSEASNATASFSIITITFYYFLLFFSRRRFGRALNKNEKRSEMKGKREGKGRGREEAMQCRRSEMKMFRVDDSGEVRLMINGQPGLSVSLLEET
ncbi:hypothetical protein TWF225_011774 [Orbilia oligospora]|uniref:Uncharacterized protein n=1 Tax=Orbilia oligospora TaxID=2813651 RepID=A0A7C8P2S1_ORBOL|nr:hypothetical protein TWF751_003825 [Orbilia oligospora]KAF3168458.1 hypothetical protein TWF225_011774 [Orbilia oligospora]KAF3235981.1 hypothetical protein TWF128_001670 [Orbilia oligospora]KAF3248048.1 hypothetical protein TWF217_009498 [Orbilia oligospora]TGJ74526.1 hypothetical protein EYR41_001520 [Orbilia oligospora]